MKLEDFLAKCLRCGTELILDQMGTDQCPKCNDEFRDKGDYVSMANLSIRQMDEQDNQILIIPRKKLEELKLVIQRSSGSET